LCAGASVELPADACFKLTDGCAAASCFKISQF
jgi:hypothetical protein